MLFLRLGERTDEFCVLWLRGMVGVGAGCPGVCVVYPQDCVLSVRGCASSGLVVAFEEGRLQVRWGEWGI